MSTFKEKVSGFFKKIKNFILPILLLIAGFVAKIFVLDEMKKKIEEKGEVVKKEMAEMKVEQEKTERSQSESERTI
jgi:hypothetical protein